MLSTSISDLTKILIDGGGGEGAVILPNLNGNCYKKGLWAYLDIGTENLHI
jgi:hypothetical protein